jgi:glycosyltransferase involved in cell wall biosynthesis
MRKVLHIIDSMGLGGAEKLLVSVINELDGKYEQHLIALRKPDTLLGQVTPGCKTSVINFKSVFNLWQTVRRVRKYIRQHNIDVVHSHLYWPNVISRLATPRNVKLINSLHAITSQATYKIRRSHLYIDKLTYRKRCLMVGVSGEVLRDFDKWVGLKGPSVVLYNFIDEKFFAAQHKTRFTNGGLRLVAVGNLRWQKNYTYITGAFKTMPPGVSIDIYGEGKLRYELQSVIDEHKLAVRLCGHHHQLENILPQYDMLVMCSLYEGFSLGLMEAMACGLPPVLSKIPVLEEAAGDCALYININDPSDLVHTVQRVLDGSVDLVSLSQKAHARARSLASRKTHIDKLITLYG